MRVLIPRLWLAAALAVCLPGCRTVLTGSEEPLAVKKVAEEIIVAAWADASALPSRGGQAQLLVRVQKRGGTPFPGVEVRLQASSGTLYSGGKILITDNRGMTRDRLTTRTTATVTLNAGGTRYRFK